MNDQRSNASALFARPISRRSLLKLGAGAASLTAGLSLFPEASFAANKIEKQLNVMGWSEYISPKNIKAWEKMTGARFVFDAYSSNDEMLSKLELAGGHSGYDLGMNTDFMIRLLINKKLIQKIDKKRIPNLANVDPNFLGRPFDPHNDYTVPKTWGSEGFIYDKSKIKRKMVSWGDFIEAAKNEASGKVALLDDPLSIAPLFWKDDVSWNTKDTKEINRVAKEVNDLAPHIRTFNTYPAQDIASGAVILAQNWNGYARLAMQSAKNPNLEFVFPEPKSELWLDSYHMPTGGKHPNAAYSWLEFILDPKRAAKEIEYTGYVSPVIGAKKYLPADIANDPLIFPSEAVVKRGERTVRNETYAQRISIFTQFKAAAAVA